MTEDKEFEKYIERRAEQLGLPTDPEAYQDGGLVTLVTARDLQHADLIACQLRGAGIPAWVDGQYMATLYWHALYGLHPGGLRVVIPASRMADAKAVLENPQDWDPKTLQDTEPPPLELHKRFLRRSRILALLTILTCLAPILFFMAYHLAVQIRREVRRGGETPELRKSARRTLAVMVINGAILFFFLAVAGLMGIR
ncbi:MAG: hypothetical protein NT049_05905 [Planctomycetota bacterium]|nr:hypothetical protein [Planctomycetota bacterium]